MAWQETIWFKPKLRPGDAKAMEKSLSDRFATVSKRFGQGLKAVIKGTAFGIGVGLLAKLLNPLQELEEKIKALLGKGREQGELAARLGADAGQLQRTQAVAQSFGVQPDQFKELLLRFAEGVETARKELEDPYSERSEATKTLKDFLGPNILENFLAFAKKNAAEASGPGRVVPIGDTDQTRNITGKQNAAEIERLIFGQQQFGAMSKFLNSDVNKTANAVGIPSQDALSKALQKTLGLSNQADRIAARDESTDLVSASSVANAEMVQKLAELEKAKQDKLNTQIATGFTDLQKAAIALEEIKEGLFKMQQPILKGIGELPGLVQDIRGIINTGFFRKGFKFWGK